MNMNTTERIVTSFTNKELKQLVIATRMYNMNTGNRDGVLLNKLVDAFLMSNELEAIETDRIARKDPYSKDVPKAYWGTASGKAYLAELEAGSTEAYSY
jgi:hypothetical protein